MTAFTKENLQKRGETLYYVPADAKTWADFTFIARFKNGRSGAGAFKSFLIKNYTLEEYVDEYNKGTAPLKILQQKGFVLPHVKKMLKAKGYPLTHEGFLQMIKDDIEARKAA